MSSGGSRRSRRSFREFLNGDVDIETGRITGRAALLQIAAMPIILALCGILGSEVRANDHRAAALATVALNSGSGGAPTLRSVNVEFPDPGWCSPAATRRTQSTTCLSAGMILTQPLAGMVATDAIGRWTPRLRRWPHEWSIWRAID